MDPFDRQISPEANARIVDHYRAMTPSERFQEMLDLNAFATQTQINAVRLAHPNADEFEIKMRVASRWVRNPELLKAAFGWDVAEKGY